MKLLLLTLVLKWSAVYGVDPVLVLSVISVESGFRNISSVSGQDHGIMQLNEKAFSDYSIKELKNPEINIRLGIKHLKEAQLRCKYKANNSFVVCFNSGIAGGSRLAYPLESEYYRKVTREYKAYRKMQVFKN